MQAVLLRGVQLGETVDSGVIQILFQAPPGSGEYGSAGEKLLLRGRFGCPGTGGDQVDPLRELLLTEEIFQRFQVLPQTGVPGSLPAAGTVPGLEDYIGIEGQSSQELPGQSREAAELAVQKFLFLLAGEDNGFPGVRPIGQDSPHL